MNDQPRWLPPIDFQSLSELKELNRKLLPSFRAYQFLRDALEDLATSPDLPAVKHRRAVSYFRYVEREFKGLEAISEEGL
jgi:hypothetical protein